RTSRRARLVERRDEAGVETTAIAELVRLGGKHVIDAGCGEGRLTTFAAARAASVYAFDPNAKSVAAERTALTKEQRERVRLAVHDAEAVDFVRARFDVALSAGRCDASPSRASCTPCTTSTPPSCRTVCSSTRSRSRLSPMSPPTSPSSARST